MKTILAFMLLITSSFLQAQTKHEISAGAGLSFFGWGDIGGIALTSTYNYQFSKHFGVEPRFICSTGWYKNDVSYNTGEHYTSGYEYGQTGYYGEAVSLVYTPFAVKGSFFKLKSGFLAGSITHSHGTKVTGAYPMEYSDFGQQYLYGLIHTVNFRILNKEKFFLGTELSMLTSFSEGAYNCDGFIWNFMGGIKF